MKRQASVVLGLLLGLQSNVFAATPNNSKAVVIVSGGAAVSPFTTPKSACKTGYAAGSTDTYMRDYLLAKGYKVFTSPAMAGYGPVPAEADVAAGPFADCPKALPEYMTVNSTLSNASVASTGFVKSILLPIRWADCIHVRPFSTCNRQNRKLRRFL